MRQSKRWNIAEGDSTAAESLAAQLKTSSIVGQLLLNRGMRELQDCQDFLRPSLKSLHDPATIPGLTRAAERVAKAIADKQKIVIYGDYDVDGITATAILWHAIRTLGGTCDFYIPHRIEEGYGLNAEAIEQICTDGAGLILTVDCGVTAIIPARVAAEHGVDLIITDHHEWHETQPQRTPILPDCYCIVHPRLPGETPAYPNPHLLCSRGRSRSSWLCGIGLAVSGRQSMR